MKAWGVFSGKSGVATAKTGYSTAGVSSISYSSYGNYRVTLSSPPDTTSRPLAFVGAIESSYGISNTSTYNIRAAGWDGNAAATAGKVTNIYIGATQDCDTIQFMVIW
jgi:hypothetical protein